MLCLTLISDLLPDFDRENIISIDVRPTHSMLRDTFLRLTDHRNLQVHHNVSPDSLLVLRAAQEVVQEPGFDQKLQLVEDRIEYLERTKAL